MRQFAHHKYTLTPKHDWTHHSWSVHCAEGAIEFNVQLHGNYDPSCGLEFHSRTPVRDEAPSHIDCHLLKCPCWHDGTSLYASTLWKDYGVHRLCETGNHKAIFTLLESEANKHWENDDENT